MKNAASTIPPFLKILPFAVAGILAAQVISVPTLVLAASTAACLICAAVWRKNMAGTVYVSVAVALASMLTANLRTTPENLPYGQTAVLRTVITDMPQKNASGDWRCTARYSSADGTSGKIFLYLPAETAPEIGQMAFAEVECGRLPDNGYGRLMRRRGYGGSCKAYAVFDYRPTGENHSSLTIAARRVQQVLLGRLARLGLQGDAAAVCQAMALGYRAEVSPAMKEGYARSGVAHLLAVSGLHVGIAALLVNMILFLLPLAGRRGHVWRNWLAIALVWLYAAVTGFSPSAVRAAVMFGALQAAYAYGRLTSSANILAGTATVMLIFNPNYLFDVSFLMSSAAVAGIAIGFAPMMKFTGGCSKAVRAIWATVAISFCASIAVAPITAYVFGRLPLAGILLSPFTALSSCVIVATALAWVVVPAPFWGGAARRILYCSAQLQNSSAEWLGGRSWGSVEVKAELWQVFAAYAIIIAVLMAFRKPIKPEPWRLER